MKRLALTRILLLHSSDISLHIFKSDWCFFQYAMRFCLVMEMGGILMEGQKQDDSPKTLFCFFSNGPMPVYFGQFCFKMFGGVSGF